MSRIEEMLKELCPDGVEYKKIAEVSSYEQPGPYIVHSTDYDDEYDTPVLTAGQTFILGYTDETDGIYSASKQQPVILFDDFTGALKWVDFPFKVKSSAVKFIKSCDEVMLRYLYFCMCSLDFSSKEHKRLWISKYSHFEIPVPPLAVQREVVRVLDTMTELTTELTTKLNAELTARTKQYTYYRDALLKLEGVEGVEYRKLGDVAVFYDGYPFKKKQFGDEGIPIIRTTNLQDGMIDISTAMKCATYDTSLEKYRIQYGDVLIGMSGTIKIARNLTHEKMLLNQRVGIFRGSNVLSNNYLYHYLCAHINDLYDMCSGGTVVNLSKKALLNFTIPVPPLQVQQDIVTKLDAFSSYCTDLTSGLPAEIAAREKQYAYYRDMMLSFPIKNK